MKKIFIVIFLFASQMAQAQIKYYIDPTGSDVTGNGTIGKPWKSLYKACATVKTSGGIIYVNSGTYIETAQSVLSVGVNIEGAGNTSIIHSHITNAPAIRLNSASEGTNGNQSISYIRMEGGLTAYSAIEINARRNVSIHYCEFEDFAFKGIIFDGRANGSGDTPTIRATGNKFYNNIVTNCGSCSGSNAQGNLCVGGQKGLEIYDNTIIQENRGTSLNGFAIKFAGKGFCEGLKIYNNTITVPPLGESIWDFAIELWNSRGGIEIYNNIIQGTIDFGCSGSYINNDEGGYGYAAKVYDNIIGQSVLRPTEESGIDIERNLSGGFYIFNNLFKNLTYPIRTSMTSGESFKDLYIYYNIINGVGTSGHSNVGIGIMLGHYSTDVTYENINVLNNVIYAGNSGVPLDGIRLQFRGPTRNITIRNNIIQGFTNCPIYGLNSTINIMSVENNIYYNNAENAGQYSNCAITNKIEQNNLNINPLFKIPGTDFDIQSTSPAINAGLDVDLTTDYIGDTIVGLPDIGAYEFMSNHPPLIMNQSFQTYKNSPDGTVVGTVMASDPDTDQSLEYSIVSGNTGGVFTINASTGVLSVANHAALNADLALVVKVQDNGTGNLSSQATLTINVIPMGIESTGNNSTIKVYPNPMSDLLIIEVKENYDRQNFEIFNSIGQNILKGNLSERTVITTTNFSPGVYLIKLENEKYFEFKKIMKV